MNSNNIRRWLWFNCPKDASWIVFQNLKEIIVDSKYHPHGAMPPPALTAETQIKYIYGTSITDKLLVCLLETKDGYYWINNEKIVETPVVAESSATETSDPVVDEIEKLLKEQDPTPTPTDSTSTSTDSTPTATSETDERKEQLKLKYKSLQKLKDMKKATNEQKATKVTVKSDIYGFREITDMWEVFTKNELATLNIKKKNQLEFTNAQENIHIPLPYEYSDHVDDVAQINRMLNYVCRPRLSVQLELHANRDKHLDLTYNFMITDKILTDFEPDTNTNISRITFHTNINMRSFQWLNASWAKNLVQVDLTNLNHFINESLTKVVSELPNITDLHVSNCPQVNVRCLLYLLKLNKLERLSLNDTRMACQPNVYGGLITEEEWDNIRDYKLKTLFINSKNMVLDIVDYIRQSCCKLELCVIDHDLLLNLHKNLVFDRDPDEKDLIKIASTQGAQLELGRSFIVKDLLKQKFQKPYSDTMLKVMKKIIGDSDPDSKIDTLFDNKCKLTSKP